MLGGIIASTVIRSLINIRLTQILSNELERNGISHRLNLTISKLIEQSKASKIKANVPQIFANSLHLGNWILLIGICAVLMFITTIGNARFRKAENEQFQEKRISINH